jgi:Kef-type K+ transport system membrane component KefB
MLALRLRQPLIVAFMVVGILVGPSGFGWVASRDQVDLLARIGITVLLFVVGLKLDLHLVRQLGLVAVATGLGQLFFTIVLGFGLGLLLGLGTMSALYVAVALTFSSTIIIVKLLSDKRELDALHGRIALGFLIVQDIAAVVAMAVVGAEGGARTELFIQSPVLLMVLRLALALLGILLLMRYVLPRLLAFMAPSEELLLIFAVAWGTSLATAGELSGFGKEVGAFLAGFSLASSRQRDQISSRLRSLRDFLLLFFFIELGARLDLSTLGAELFPALVLSGFVLVGNPLIVMAIMGYMGYRRRTGFLAGLTVAQISEFSILFIAMGIRLGHIDISALGLVTLVGLITITLSTYMILYSHVLYRWLAPWLGLFERREPHRELAFEARRRALHEADVVVVGVGRYGLRIARELQRAGLRVAGVDFDPQAVQRAEHEGISVYLGDAAEPEILASFPKHRRAWIVSTVPYGDSNLALWRELNTAGVEATVAMAAFNDRDVERLTQAGVPRLLLPYTDASTFAARSILEEIEQRSSGEQ